MRLGTLLLVIVAPALGLAAAVNSAGSPASHLQSSEVTQQESESRRLRAHFDTVLAELRSVDVSSLGEAQQARRATAIAWLAEYRDAGIFPINDGYAPGRVPIFRDRRGSLCAVGYLLDRSGRGDVVEQVAGSRNLARIAELADDPALHEWLEETGLTVAEAARIQPNYGGWGPEPEPEPNTVAARFAFASMLVGGSSVTTGAFNLVRPTRVAGAAGVVIGAAAIGLGAGNLDGATAATRGLAIADVMLGAASAALGVRSLLMPRPVPKADAETRATAASAVQVTPLVSTTRRDGASVGLLLRATF